jgi:hypothetical protein
MTSIDGVQPTTANCLHSRWGPAPSAFLSIFTGNHFGSGEALENAIGLVSRELADYVAYRQ